MRRGLYIADGSSDLPLARHLEHLCRVAGAEVDVVDVSADRLRDPTVEGRLRTLLDEDPDFAVVFVHRDAEDRDPSARYQEVAHAVASVAFSGPSIAVVPIRMTEAWLLLDEWAIRQVAGRPSGKVPLGLPPLNAVERVADPKRALGDALVSASELTGRRLKVFRRQFPTHRRLLLERLDPTGPVSHLSAWTQLVADIQRGVSALGAAAG